MSDVLRLFGSTGSNGSKESIDYAEKYLNCLWDKTNKGDCFIATSWKADCNFTGQHRDWRIISMLQDREKKSVDRDEAHTLNAFQQIISWCAFLQGGITDPVDGISKLRNQKLSYEELFNVFIKTLEFFGFTTELVNDDGSEWYLIQGGDPGTWKKPESSRRTLTKPSSRKPTSRRNTQKSSRQLVTKPSTLRNPRTPGRRILTQSTPRRRELSTQNPKRSAVPNHGINQEDSPSIPMHREREVIAALQQQVIDLTHRVAFFEQETTIDTIKQLIEEVLDERDSASSVRSLSVLSLDGKQATTSNVENLGENTVGDQLSSLRNELEEYDPESED
jgi:hypothetical protein